MYYNLYIVKTEKQFEIIFAKTYPNFTKDLVDKYGKFSYNELKMCMYLRMGFSNEKILNEFNISKSTFANLRSGVRKKMGLKRSQNLVNSILSI